MQVPRLETPLLFLSPQWGVTGVGGALHGSSEVVLTMVTLSNISTSGFNHGTQIGAALQDWIGNVGGWHS